MGTQIPQKAQQPPLFGHVYCGQTAAWIKMPLGTAVGLSPGHTVLDGDLACPERGTAAPPHFSAHVYCGQTVGWIKMPVATEVDLGSGHTVLHGDPAPHEKGRAAPLFSAHVYCGQMVESPISATAGHLLHSSPQSDPLLYNWSIFHTPSQKCLFPLGNLD